MLQGLVQTTSDDCSFILLCHVSVQQFTNIWQQFILENILESDRYSIYKEAKLIWKTVSLSWFCQSFCVKPQLRKLVKPGFSPHSDPCFPCHIVLLTPCTTAHSGLLVTVVFNSAPVALGSADWTFFSSTFIITLTGNTVDEGRPKKTACNFKKKFYLAIFS